MKVTLRMSKLVVRHGVCVCCTLQIFLRKYFVLFVRILLNCNIP